MKLNYQAVAIATLIASAMVAIPPAQAEFRSKKVTTSAGTVSAKGVQGTNGGAGCVKGARYGVSAGKVCKINGVNGSATNASGAAAGVGGFRKINRTYTNPTTGNTTSASVNSRYNAQTGQGSRSIDRSKTVNGTSYGYETNNNYNYEQGSGVSGTSTIQTQNKGTYTCTYATGSSKTCIQQ